jgi:hypothetical protein
VVRSRHLVRPDPESCDCHPSSFQLARLATEARPSNPFRLTDIWPEMSLTPKTMSNLDPINPSSSEGTFDKVLATTGALKDHFLTKLHTERPKAGLPFPPLFETLSQSSNLNRLAESICGAVPREHFRRKPDETDDAAGEFWQAVASAWTCIDRIDDLAGGSGQQTDWSPFHGERYGPRLLIHARTCKDTWCGQPHFDLSCDFRLCSVDELPKILGRLGPWLQGQGIGMPSQYFQLGAPEVVALLNQVIDGRMLRPPTLKESLSPLPPNTPLPKRAEENWRRFGKESQLGASSPAVATHNRLVLEFCLWPWLRLPEEGEVSADLSAYFKSVRTSLKEIVSDKNRAAVALVNRINLLLSIAGYEDDPDNFYDGPIDHFREGHPPLWSELKSAKMLKLVAEKIEKACGNAISACCENSPRGEAARKVLLDERTGWFESQGKEPEAVLVAADLRRWAIAHCKVNTFDTTSEQCLHFVEHVIYVPDPLKTAVNTKKTRGKQDRLVSQTKVLHLIEDYLGPKELERMRPEDEPDIPSSTDGGRAEFVQRLLDSLSPRPRKIVQMRHGCDDSEYSISDIARILDMTRDVVESTYSNQLKALKGTDPAEHYADRPKRNTSPGERIVRMHHGLNHGFEYSFEEVSRAFNMTKKEATDMYEMAMKTLRGGI